MDDPFWEPGEWGQIVSKALGGRLAPAVTEEALPDWEAAVLWRAAEARWGRMNPRASLDLVGDVEESHTAHSLVVLAREQARRTTCEECGADLPANHRSDARYCPTGPCRMRASRRRKALVTAMHAAL